MVHLGEQKADGELQMGSPQHGRSLSVYHHADYRLRSWGGSSFPPSLVIITGMSGVHSSPEITFPTFILFNLVLYTIFTCTSYHPPSTYEENETESSGDFSAQSGTKEVMAASLLLNP